jgi:hypothetical protein
MTGNCSGYSLFFDALFLYRLLLLYPQLGPCSGLLQIRGPDVIESKQNKILRRGSSDVDADHLMWMPTRDVAARHGADARWRKQILGAQAAARTTEG